MIALRYLLLAGFFVLSLVAGSQPLRDINFAYLYDTAQAFSFSLNPVRGQDHWFISYKLIFRDDAAGSGDLTIAWETKETLNDRENTPLDTARARVDGQVTAEGMHGVVRIPLSDAPNILVAKVASASQKKAWIFYRILYTDYPVNGALARADGMITEGFVRVHEPVRILQTGEVVVSYYDNDFPAALPPFSEKPGPVAQAILPDSTFTLSPGDTTAFTRSGLYLAQRDTASSEGFSFRVEEDYPRLARISSLAGPMIYIFTKAEHDRMSLAKDEKKVFDRIVLNITNDRERAKHLIRSYFRRVEAANIHFTSYKEGWKTDRGMVMIIYGLPDEVFRFEDREVWTYDRSGEKTTFNFASAPSIFDPDNYVLVRDYAYRDAWNKTLELWRSARF